MSIPPLACAARDATRPRPAERPISGLNCLSIDVEEYFQCEVFAGCVPRSEWHKLEPRAEPLIERLAELLDRHGSRATFFVLGWMVPRLAPILRELVRRGHEIACHGDNHEHLGRMTGAGLREDLRAARGKIEEALGVSPRGYRAPTFSITRATAWALDTVVEQGFEYDSSIFPIRHDRYGVPDAPTGPFWAATPCGARIVEFPPLTVNLGLARIPVGGGGYMRLLPGAVLRRALAARRRKGEPAMIYLHPWELDPRQPRLPVGPFSQWRHRVNLHTTEPKLERLLTEFRFDTAAAVLSRVTAERDLPVFDVSQQSGARP